MPLTSPTCLLRERALGVLSFFSFGCTLSVCRAFSFFWFFGCSPGTYVSTYTADTTLVHTQFQRYVYWYPAGTRYIRADTRYVRILVFSSVKRRLLAQKVCAHARKLFGGDFGCSPILYVRTWYHTVVCRLIPGTNVPGRE